MKEARSNEQKLKTQVGRGKAHPPSTPQSPQHRKQFIKSIRTHQVPVGCSKLPALGLLFHPSRSASTRRVSVRRSGNCTRSYTVTASSNRGMRHRPASAAAVVSIPEYMGFFIQSAARCVAFGAASGTHLGFRLSLGLRCVGIYWKSARISMRAGRDTQELDPTNKWGLDAGP